MIELNNTAEENDGIKLPGTRPINFMFLLEQIQLKGKHSPFDCTFLDMIPIKEIQKGLHYTWTFRCKMCHLVQTIESDNGKMSMTEAAVAGTILSGNGHTVLQKITSSMNIPPISTATYQKHADNIYKHLNEICWEEMRSAAEEEKRLAILRGDVDEDGVPFITVITDGCWCKRSYKNSYDSLGGVGVIVGAVTKKVLYIGVFNKFCLRCAVAKNRNEEPAEHVCFKNWSSTKSSCSMESEALIEGFKCSESLYGTLF